MVTEHEGTQVAELKRLAQPLFRCEAEIELRHDPTIHSKSFRSQLADARLILAYKEVNSSDRPSALASVRKAELLSHVYDRWGQTHIALMRSLLDRARKYKDDATAFRPIAAALRRTITVDVDQVEETMRRAVDRAVDDGDASALRRFWEAHDLEPSDLDRLDPGDDEAVTRRANEEAAERRAALMADIDRVLKTPPDMG